MVKKIDKVKKKEKIVEPKFKKEEKKTLGRKEKNKKKIFVFK